VIRFVASCCAAALLLAACGGGGSGAAPGEGTRSLSFLVFGDAVELAAYRELVRSFEAERPGFDVQLLETSTREELMARLSTSFAGGSPPEVFLVNHRFVGQFAARGVLEDLGGRIAASDAISLDDYYEPAVESFRFDGELPCLAQNISSLVIYYNRDLFREAGVAEPEAGWDWNAFVETAKALTADRDGDGAIDQYGLGVEAGSILRLAPFVWSAGGELVDDPERPRQFTLDTPEGRFAMGSFFSLRRAHGVIATEEELESETDESRFLNGRLGMLMESRRATVSLRTISDFDWDVAPLPVLRQPAGILHSDGFCLTSGSGDPDAGWAFIEWALGADGQSILARSGRTVPSLRSVAESEAFLDPDAKPANARVWLDTAPILRAVPTISTWPEIEQLAEQLMEIGMYDDLEPQDLAPRLDALTRDLFAEAAQR
jgi:multiple sugar transport system substrate-binding protein